MDDLLLWLLFIYGWVDNARLKQHAFCYRFIRLLCVCARVFSLGRFSSIVSATTKEDADLPGAVYLLVMAESCPCKQPDSISITWHAPPTASNITAYNAKYRPQGKPILSITLWAVLGVVGSGIWRCWQCVPCDSDRQEQNKKKHHRRKI